MITRHTLLAAAIVLLGGAGLAQAGTLTAIQSYADPLGGATSVLGINNAGWMTGNVSYADGTAVGFIRDAAGVYITFSAPGDVFTAGRGINNANTVTGYGTSVPGNVATLASFNEYTRAADGSVTVLTNPAGGAPLHGIAENTNDLGATVGDYQHGAASNKDGYVLSGGVLTTLTDAGSTNIRARGIANDGTIVGFATVGGISEGFIDVGGVFSYFSDPNATAGNTGAIFEDINNNGLIVGQWNDAAGRGHAFQFNSFFDVFTEIMVDGATSVNAFGVNDHGDVVLSTDVAAGPNNFVYNASAVPEPAAWALMLTGFLGLGTALRGRRAALAA